MTDEQIIKAFEEILKNQNNKLSLIERDVCGDVLSLAIRQKAEIERLKKKNTILSKMLIQLFQDGLDENRDLFKKEVEPEIRNEAIKEFVEKLTDMISVYSKYVDVDGIVILNRIFRIIEYIEKEMTEEGK